MRLKLTLGTDGRDALRRACREAGLQTNAYGEALWESLEVAPRPRELEVVLLTACELLGRGGTFDAVLAAAAGVGLGPCPLEVGPRLRLCLDEPPGSARLTVVSSRPNSDELSPRGFYLRTDAAGRWLRGFVASDDWEMEGAERLVLAVGDVADSARRVGVLRDVDHQA